VRPSQSNPASSDIQKLKAAEETLLVIVAKEKEEGEASSHLRRAMEALQEALLRIQLSR
jgi:hypothetical protein